MPLDQPTLSPTRTPLPALPVGWKYWPNAADFRQVAADGDTLWVATLSGLVRYEPAAERWRVWTTIDGLVDNTCVSVTVWRDEVWVGTQGGVSRFNPASNSWRSYGLAEGLAGLHNTLLYLDPYAQVLWAGTLEGLASYDRQADRWVTVQAQGNDLAGVISFWAKPDALWVSVPPGSESDPGIWRLDRATGTWHNALQARGIPPSDQYVLAGDQSYLWALGMRGTPYELDRASGKWRVVDAIATRRAARFEWLAYQAPDLWLWDGQKWLRYDAVDGRVAYLRPPANCSVPQGAPVFASDVAWFPIRTGFCAVDLASLEWIYHVRTDLPAQIEQVYEGQGPSLLVYSMGHLGLFDPSTSTWQLLPAIPGTASAGVPDVAQQSENRDLWVYLAPTPPDTVSPLQSLQIWHYVAPDSRPEYTLESVAVPATSVPQRLLPMVDRGRLWFLGSGALFAYDAAYGMWQRYPLGNSTEYLSFGAQDREAIWLLSGGRTLLRFDLGRLTTTTYPIPFGRRWTLVSTSGHQIWLAGDSNRLLSLVPETEQWLDVTLDSGCIGPWVIALAASGDTIWASGERGVVSYDGKTGQQQCYRRGNGMLDDRATQIIIQGDWVWFRHPWRGLWGRGLKGGGEP